MIRFLVLIGLTAAGLGLNACGETPQSTAGKKTDTQGWESTDSSFSAAGWKSGDRASWEEQLRSRAQSQNDYAKTK